MIGRLITWLDRRHARRDERHRSASTPPPPSPYRVLIVPSLADPTAPTAAELQQGIDITPDLMWPRLCDEEADRG